MIHKDAAKKQQPAQHPRWEGHHEMHARPPAWEGHHEMHARPAAWEGHHEMHARPAVWEWHDDLHARPPAPQALLVNAQQTSAAFSPVIVHTAAANPAKLSQAFWRQRNRVLHQTCGKTGMHSSSRLYGVTWLSLGLASISSCRVLAKELARVNYAIGAVFGHLHVINTPSRYRLAVSDYRTVYKF